MADKGYSIDDILNEYSGSTGSGSKADLDELLNDYGSKKSGGFSTDKVTLHNTDIFEKPVTPDLSDIKIELTGNIPAQKKESEDSGFEKKYEQLNEKVNAIKERTEEERQEKKAPAVKKPDRSFSEKMEQGVVYEDEKKEKESLADRFTRLKKGGEQEKPQEKPAEAPAPKKPAKENPFDKYEGISDDVQAEEKPDPFSSGVIKKEKSLDDILAEYAPSDTKKKHNKDYTQHKGLTGFFTRMLPDDLANQGNTELIDGMMRMKKERMSRTQHISPIERKSISDIDLNLDDKIIPDTAQLNIDKENSELIKLNELKERRSKKIKDFVLVGDEEEIAEAEAEETQGVQREIEDFEAFEDAPSVAADIEQLKNSLVMRMLVLLICFGASAYIAIANDTGNLPIPELFNKKTQVNTYLFVNAIIGLLAAFASYNVISCGLSKLISMKADCDSLCAVAAVTSIASSMIMFANPTLVQYSLVHIYITAAICALMFNTAGKMLIVTRTQRSFRFVSGGSEKYALFTVEDEEKAQNFTRGALRDFPRLASMRKTEFLTDFLKTAYASDSTDKFCCLFTPIVIVAALIVALLAGFTANNDFGASSIYIGLAAFVGCVSMCSAFSMMLVVNMPMAKASKKNAEFHGAVIGYDCIEEFADTNSILVDATQLFPQGSVNLSAIKVFSDTRIDEAIVEAASLTNQAGSILKNMFYDIIAGKTELLNPVESYIFEDSMGLCGWINNKRVLLGNRELMINHSIEGIPSVAKEQEYTKNGRSAVYLSISGELSAMFVVELKPSLEVKQALANLQKQEIYTVVRSVDSLVTINHLSELFDISPEFFKLLPFRSHKDFDEVVTYQPKQHATVACTGNFAALSSLVLSCRNLRGTISTGIAIEAVAILLGILICLAMVILKSFGEITVTMTITYNLIFTAVLLVFQFFRKN
ncbi:MAG: hypothetical protein IJF18_00505 [Oscillospiraceae bacterium]|nr:hypothetical protein [Oscillospiraceae bacterium]